MARSGWSFEALEKWVIAELATVRAEALTREEFEQRHSELQAHDEERARVLQAGLDRQREVLEARLANLESWKANVLGRAVGLGVVGGLIIAGITAILTHLIGGG